MANKLTLDQVLADLYEHTGDKDLDTEWVNVVQKNNKQAILQWIADEVVGEKISHKAVSERLVGIKDSTSIHDAVYAVNGRIDVQRKILKAHGWKE